MVFNCESASGRFHEVKIDVVVNDGRLTIAIGGPDNKTNSCLNWLVFWKLN